VNLACFSGIYYSLLRITGSSAAYAIGFLVGTECSIVFNFVLNDRLTFGDLHARTFSARCLRYHVTSLSGVLLTLGISFSLLHLLHVSALPAQAAALVVATGWNFVFHHVFTYGHVAAHTRATTANTGGLTL
jgi:putative flippase GtrA